MSTLPSLAEPTLVPSPDLGPEVEFHAEGYRLLVVDRSTDADIDVERGMVALRDPTNGELFLVSLRDLVRPAGAHLVRQAGEHLAAAILGHPA